MNPISSIKAIPASVSRILVIACHAFTQLVRMKVFYFLAFFAVILIASNFFNLPQHEGPESAGVNVLRSIKSWSLGAMTLFSVVLSIVATALLLPKDVEDRTLYTILAKPVPRMDYLAGKLLGVLMSGVRFPGNDGRPDGRHPRVADEHDRDGADRHRRGTRVAGGGHRAAESRHPRQGPTASLQGAVFAIFLRSSIIASMALLISTFSSSTLFTTIISFLIYFIGHFQADARAAYLSQDAGTSDRFFARAISLLVALILPDFQMFNVIDAVIEGQVMPLVILGKLTLIGLFYAIFYIIGSWFVFAKKEF